MEDKLCKSHFKLLLNPDPTCLGSLPIGHTFTHPSSPEQNVISSEKPFLTSPAELVSPLVAFLVPTQEGLPLRSHIGWMQTLAVRLRATYFPSLFLSFPCLNNENNSTHSPGVAVDLQ